MVRKVKAFTYYVIDKLMSMNAIFNFIIGGRGIGKTFGYKKYVLDQFFKHGHQFIYLRRWKSELKGRGEFIADIGHLYPDYTFRVLKNRLETAKIKYDDEGDPLPNDKLAWRTVGFFIALSVAANEKSVPYPRVTSILFDEFIIEKGAVTYLPEEVRTFLNFYSTVDRNQDKTRVFFMANSVSIHNPYFLYWKIRPQADGTFPEFTRMKSGRIVVQVVDSEDFKNEVYNTEFGQIIKGTEFADFAVESSFRDGHGGMVRKKPEDAKYWFTIELREGIVTIWQYDVYHFHVSDKRPGNELVYTTKAENVAEDRFLLMRNDKPMQKLRTAFRTGRCTFDGADTRNIFLDVFKR